MQPENTKRKAYNPRKTPKRAVVVIGIYRLPIHTAVSLPLDFHPTVYEIRRSVIFFSTLAA